MAFLRTLVFGVLAMAVAIAPAAPCTMSRHSASDHAHAAEATAPDAHAHHRHHHHAANEGDGLSEPMDGAPNVGSDPRQEVLGGAADPSAPGLSHVHHRNSQGHHKRMAGCVAACCPLACQAAVPDAPWSETALELRPSDPIGIRQEDGVADPRPLRIERPPRRIG